MVVESLVDIDIQAGTQVLKALEAAGIQVVIALWARLEDYGDWRLFISSETLDQGSVFDAYSRIAVAVGGEFVFSAPTIAYMPLSDPFVRAVREKYASSSSSFGLRLRGLFGGRFVEEAFVYRIV